MAVEVSLPLLPFHAKLVADFSAANQNSLGIGDFVIGQDIQKAFPREILDRRRCVGMAQHALRSEYHQRLAPLAHTCRRNR